MKKLILIPVFILIIMLLFCQKQNKEELVSLEKAQEKERIAPIAKEVENRISSAINNLEKGNVTEAANLLLEAILLTKPSEYLPDDFEEIILAAKEQFQAGNIHKGVELVSEALMIVKSDSEIKEERDRAEPKDVGQPQKKDEPPPIAPIAEMVRNKILAAREEFKKGNADKGVILILESLQLFGPRKD
jgi:hypothetical protein